MYGIRRGLVKDNIPELSAGFKWQRQTRCCEILSYSAPPMMSGGSNSTPLFVAKATKH